MNNRKRPFIPLALFCSVLDDLFTGVPLARDDRAMYGVNYRPRNGRQRWKKARATGYVQMRRHR